MENRIAVPQKIKHTISIWSHYCTFRYIPKRIKSRDSNIYLHTHVHSSIIHKSWKVEITQLSIDGWMDKQNMDIHALEYYSVMKTKEKSDTCYNMVDHSVQLSHSVVSESLQPHGLQHARLPCPSPTSGACSNSRPSSWWCHPTISSSVFPFSYLQSFPDQGLF